MLLNGVVGRLLVCLIIITIQCQWLLMVSAYSQVSSSGSGDGPKIYKALNLDLIYPKSFNSSEKVISTTTHSGLLATSAAMGSEEVANMNVVIDNGRQQQRHGQEQHQQYHPLPQSNEQKYQDANGDAVAVGIADDDDDDKRPLYVTPIPNEAALYEPHGRTNMDKNNRNRNGVNSGNDAQVVTANPINIQHQQQLSNNNNNNNSNNSVSNNEGKEQQNTATGRAVDYHTGYPFGQLITPLIKNAPRPVYSANHGKAVVVGRPSAAAAATAKNSGRLTTHPHAVYRQNPPSKAEIDKYRGKGVFRDRFTPSEAVASHQLKAVNQNHHHRHHNHAPSYMTNEKFPTSTNVVKTYVPPKNLYAFPPSNANYPLPNQDNIVGLSNNLVNSYSPPPSGPLKDATYTLSSASSNDNGLKYSGPLSLTYLPTINNNDNGDTKDDNGGMVNDNENDSGSDGPINDANDSIGVLPASVLDGIDNSSDMNSMAAMGIQDDKAPMDGQDDHAYDTEKEYPTPPPEWLKAHPEAAQEHPSHDDEHDDSHHDHDFDHDHHHSDIIIDHDTPAYPFHHSLPSFPIYPHYPEIIYDDHYDHVHHDHHHVEAPPLTTEAPPPEPPPEPRVKKYSYFYIGRKLWYIPLYFTVWFSFYVLWLILKSIARHKVNLPNHYVARRSVDTYNLSKRQQETLNQLTVSVLDKIDNFKRQYLN